MMMAALQFLFSGCSKELEYDGGLSLSTEKVSMPAAESWHVVTVFANASWTARLSEPVEWATIDVTQGAAGLGRIQIDCQPNAGLKRAVNLIVNDGVNEDVLVISQKAGEASPVFAFRKSAVEVTSNRGTVMTGFDCNVPDDLDKVVVSLTDTAGETIDWISGVKVEADKVCFTVSATQTDRIAVLKLSLSDSDGVTLETSLSVTQKAGLK